MGIFKRVKRIIRANINGLLDKVEDPMMMLNEITRELEQEITNAQKALTRQIYAENKQKALILDIKATIEKRTRQAKLAIEHGDDTIARLAIEEKIIQENQLNFYVEQYQALQDQTGILKTHLNDLNTTLVELQNRKILLASRANVAQSIKRIQAATSSFETGNILKGISQAEDRIVLLEAEVQAGQHFTRPLLIQEATVINEDDVNKELNKLKQEQLKIG
ncbi:PspA/IM30 family protein [Lysinibacillus sp. BW-2-10]|uniref:PspA/IM30 family protein n=1 Tax=Lysinibacillus sp. BW-2-10 TaxID=2590030 RepID=UPI00117E76A5|nr:PspA/IM30 family protein [Lysinibacillus sp. BW-2-10]TSI07385.1 PspA/IM30 family protein [Lysinibacillus sp. BW-2-10]